MLLTRLLVQQTFKLPPPSLHNHSVRRTIVEPSRRKQRIYLAVPEVKIDAVEINKVGFLSNVTEAGIHNVMKGDNTEGASLALQHQTLRGQIHVYYCKTPCSFAVSDSNQLSYGMACFTGDLGIPSKRPTDGHIVNKRNEYCRATTDCQESFCCHEGKHGSCFAWR